MNKSVIQKAKHKNDWPIETLNGLNLLRSPLLSKVDHLTHAFTTRIGGSSERPLNWFNLGRHWPGKGSKQDAILNRRRLCQCLDLDFRRLVVPAQTHSTSIAWVSGPVNLPDVDGVATGVAETPLLLHYADCVPIILYAKDAEVVCVVHAGWRGTAGGIVTKAVRLMSKVANAKPREIVAAVGPAIGSCCYAVDEEVAQKLAFSAPRGSMLVEMRHGKYFPDLKAINALQMFLSGVSEIDISSSCTACSGNLFYSHRASAGQTGRQGAIACLKVGNGKADLLIR